MTPTEQDLAALYDRYAHVVYGRALRITGDAELAADAVQETFARVIVHWDQFRGESSPLTWMYRISTNWCLNQLRNRRGRDDKLVHHRHDVLPSEADTLATAEDAQRVRALLDDADDETRQIVVHIYFDELTREQTAALVGLSVPTVRKRLRGFFDRARRTLGVPLTAATALALLLILTALPLAA